ncbi:MAG TPA: hypothetical protein PKO06_21415, partial [Candidatus Ozemobacteraceae bacterium]|nr:hypothetical protein [Candidatus Ozemobacteraceae bacterium]
GFKTFVTSQNKLKLFLNAAKNKGNVRVLSSPHILAANHRKAIFKIGEKLPLISSVRPSDEGPIKTFDVKEVGLELEVTPHINRSGQIDIEIRQTINAVDQYDQKEGTARMTNREAQTNVVVTNGETLVLGGFIENKKDEKERKIPILSQVPILGKAFRSKTKLHRKTELMVFLTPRIIDTIEDAQNVTELQKRRLSERKDVNRVLKQLQRTHVPLTASTSVIIDRYSDDWQYDFDRPDLDDLVWNSPATVKPDELTLSKLGRCPFGFGPSRRLKPALVRTWTKPSEGVVLRKTFQIEDPDVFRFLTLKVASDNAATVYLNGQKLDEDPMMKMKDGHDFDYWNRVREKLSGKLLVEGVNTIVVLLGSDKDTDDGYFDMMLIGHR